MANEKGNQSQNQLQDQLNNKKADPIKIIESLINFHTSVSGTNAALEELFQQINTDSAKLESLREKLKREKSLWRFKDLEHNLQTILFLAGAFDKPQYLEFDNFVVKISKGLD